MTTRNWRANLLLLVLVALSSITGYSTEQQEPVTTIKQISYHGKTITLGDKALYLNAGLKDKVLGKYAFKTLQAAAAYAKDGTEQEPTILYLEPGVYWTDNPTVVNVRNNLIGLVMPQSNLTMIGLSDDPEKTIIAGDRGQMAGSVGNWNTIGVGDGFHAYNITFGNYCNVDLVYKPDPRKNHTKRQETVTQAQVITKANGGDMDKWLFENCRFISYLNVFARSNEPNRAYYKDCFFQCTDDAIGTGDLNVYQNCNFRLYSNHPSGSASNIIQAYLGCHFEVVLPNPGPNPTIFFAKKNNIFAIVDGVFTGNATRLEWTDEPSDAVRHYVHHNSLNGKPIVVSSSKPALSVDLEADRLNAFKVGEEYNIYNLLRGDDDWDPADQKARLGSFANLPYRLELFSDRTVLDAEKKETAAISYHIYPNRVQDRIQWSVSDPKVLSFVVNKDGTLTVSGHNTTENTLKGYLKGETSTGIQALIYLEVSGKPLPAPNFVKKLNIKEPESDRIRLDYALDQPQLTDQSIITWYRAHQTNGSDTLPVAVTRLNHPLKTLALTTGDIGYYVVAKVTPKYQSGLMGNPAMVISRKIKASDISSRDIHTDFQNLPVGRSSTIRDGFWLVDTHRPVDLSRSFKWEPAVNESWEYGRGTGITADRYGLMNSGRGARLLYSQAGTYEDMSVTLELSPHKASGQGFGSATGQYLDVYLKFDARTLTGYGLRIERVTSLSRGVRFRLYKFTNGVGTPIGEFMDSSVFLPGCKIELKVTGAQLSAHITSIHPEEQAGSGLPNEVSLVAAIEPNHFGGFGVQHTGTPANGNRLMLEKIAVRYP